MEQLFMCDISPEQDRDEQLSNNSKVKNNNNNDNRVMSVETSRQSTGASATRSSHFDELCDYSHNRQCNEDHRSYHCYQVWMGSTSCSYSKEHLFYSNLKSFWAIYWHWFQLFMHFSENLFPYYLLSFEYYMTCFYEYLSLPIVTITARYYQIVCYYFYSNFMIFPINYIM